MRSRCVARIRAAGGWLGFFRRRLGRGPLMRAGGRAGIRWLCTRRRCGRVLREQGRCRQNCEEAGNAGKRNFHKVSPDSQCLWPSTVGAQVGINNAPSAKHSDRHVLPGLCARFAACHPGPKPCNDRADWLRPVAKRRHFLQDGFHGRVGIRRVGHIAAAYVQRHYA